MDTSNRVVNLLLRQGVRRLFPFRSHLPLPSAHTTFAEVREVTSDLMKQMNDLREEPDRQYFLYGPGKKRLNIVFGLRGEGFADSFIKDRDLAFKTGDWKAVLDCTFICVSAVSATLIASFAETWGSACTHSLSRPANICRAR